MFIRETHVHQDSLWLSTPPTIGSRKGRWTSGPPGRTVALFPQSRDQPLRLLPPFASLPIPGCVMPLSRQGRELIRQRYCVEVSVAEWDKTLRAVAAKTPRPVAPLRSPSPSGRLDKILGVRLAEAIRSRCGIAFAHQCAGGEWPHTHSTQTDDQRFWELLRNWIRRQGRQFRLIILLQFWFFWPSLLGGISSLVTPLCGVTHIFPLTALR